MIAARLPQDQFDRELARLEKQLPWGSPHLNLILGHVQAVETEVAELKERVEELLVQVPTSEAQVLAEAWTPRIEETS